MVEEKREWNISQPNAYRTIITPIMAQSEWRRLMAAVLAAPCVRNMRETEEVTHGVCIVAAQCPPFYPSLHLSKDTRTPLLTPTHKRRKDPHCSRCLQRHGREHCIRMSALRACLPAGKRGQK